MSVKRRIEVLEHEENGDGTIFLFHVGGRFKEIQSHDDFFEEWRVANGVKSNPKDLVVMLIGDFHSSTAPEFMYSAPIRS